MSRSKLRDQLYGVQPKNVELKKEVLPQHPARKPYPGYCKRLKGEHLFSLVDVKVYPFCSYPGGWRSRECFVAGWADWKEYRCDGCNKKKLVREEFLLDTPVPRAQFSRPL